MGRRAIRSQFQHRGKALYSRFMRTAILVADTLVVGDLRLLGKSLLRGKAAHLENREQHSGRQCHSSHRHFHIRMDQF